jgi:hypothetical protein
LTKESGVKSLNCYKVKDQRGQYGPALLKLSVKSDDKSEDIDKYLDSALNEALKAITTKDYPGPFKLNAKDLEALAVAIYNRINVKAAFASKEALMGRGPILTT